MNNSEKKENNQVINIFNRYKMLTYDIKRNLFENLSKQLEQSGNYNFM